MQEIRARIDSIDKQIKELLNARMACSYEIARSKHEAGTTSVYCPEREKAIYEKLGEGVPDNLKVGYLSIVRAIIETSRMYQYGLLYDWNENVFQEIKGYELADQQGNTIAVRLSRRNEPNTMSSLLRMIGDYGFDMRTMQLAEEREDAVVFDLTFNADPQTDHTRKLLFQLSKECESFEITSVSA